MSLVKHEKSGTWKKIAIETECSIKRMCKISMKKCNTKG